MSAGPIRVEVSAAEGGGRLDQVLVAALERVGETVSRRGARRLIEQGAVYVDRHRVRIASRPIRAGATLAVDLGAAPASPAPVLSAAAILHEDAHLLAVDKPAGLPTQATRSDAVGHLLAAVEAYLRRRGGGGGPLGLQHRLDRGTSGVVVLARTDLARRALAAALAERRVEKVYRALVVAGATPPAVGEEWTCELPLLRVTGEGGRRITVVDPAGKPASTCFRWLGSSLPGRGLVEARPTTGRTHQLRVHLAAAGWPVAGDRLYGHGDVEERLWLHAWRLTLPHPVDGRLLELEAPLPDVLRDEVPAGSVRGGG